MGEGTHRDIDSSGAEVVADLDSIAREVDPTFIHPRVLIAYEPRWAIGEPRPASLSHIEGVCGRIRESVSRGGLAEETRVLYGGSAGRGLLSDLRGSVDGIFVGRFAHDPREFIAIVDEAMTLSSRSNATALVNEAAVGTQRVIRDDS